MGKRSRRQAPRTPRPDTRPGLEPPAEPDPPPATDRARPAAPAEPPQSLVYVAFGLALVCALAPLAVLGAAFAGGVLYTRGRRVEGASVIALAVICCAVALTVLR